jgi:hypothetical protein
MDIEEIGWKYVYWIYLAGCFEYGNEVLGS